MKQRNSLRAEKDDVSTTCLLTVYRLKIPINYLYCMGYAPGVLIHFDNSWSYYCSGCVVFQRTESRVGWWV